MIGDFDYLEAYTSGDFSGEPVLCRLYAPVGLAIHGQYSLDLAVKVRFRFAQITTSPVSSTTLLTLENACLDC